jgi:hypothetical protein
MKAKNRRFLVYNLTDGVAASPGLMTLAEARSFVRDFPRRFDRQGYYLTAARQRIRRRRSSGDRGYERRCAPGSSLRAQSNSCGVVKTNGSKTRQIIRQGTQRTDHGAWKRARAPACGTIWPASQVSRYSAGNVLLIHMQCSHATRIAGFRPGRVSADTSVAGRGQFASSPRSPGASLTRRTTRQRLSRQDGLRVRCHARRRASHYPPSRP